MLLVSGAFFSTIETSLVAMGQHRLRTIMEKNPSKAAALKKWVDDPNRLLTTMLIGINVVGITSAILTEYVADYFLVVLWKLPLWTPKVFSMVVVSLVVIEFCEIVPKITAYHGAEKWAVRLISPLVFMHRIISPIGNIMVTLGNRIIKMFGGQTEHRGPFFTQAEIIGLITSVEKQGVIEKEEREMIHSIFEFGNTTVKEVMVPRPDVIAAPLPQTVSQLAAIMERERHSRIPVYDKDIDNIVGVVNARQLMYALKAGRDHEDVRTIMHEPYFVPETKKLDDLLHNFQSKRLHMAIIVDEYGATGGVVTVEDLIEEIVGEIQDEYDTEEPLYRWLDEHTLKVDARINIDDLMDVLNTHLPTDENYDTLGGFIFASMGKVPRKGDSTKHDNFEFTVERMTGRRINTVIITKSTPVPAQTEEPAPENGGEKK